MAECLRLLCNPPSFQADPVVHFVLCSRRVSLRCCLCAQCCRGRIWFSSFDNLRKGLGRSPYIEVGLVDEASCFRSSSTYCLQSMITIYEHVYLGGFSSVITIRILLVPRCCCRSSRLLRFRRLKAQSMTALAVELPDRIIGTLG